MRMFAVLTLGLSAGCTMIRPVSIEGPPLDDTQIEASEGVLLAQPRSARAPTPEPRTRDVAPDIAQVVFEEPLLNEPQPPNRRDRAVGSGAPPETAESGDPRANGGPENPRAAMRAFNQPVQEPQPSTSQDAEVLPVPSPQQSLTLERIEQLALNANPAIGRAQAAVEAARGDWLQVGLGPNPRLGYAGEDMGAGGSVGKQGLFVEQTFVTGNKLELNRRAAAWRVERRLAELETLRLRVLTDVRIAYYEALIAQRRSKLAQELVDVSEKAVDAATSLFEGKEVSRADPLRARIEADSARILLENARNTRVETWRRLAGLIGSSESEPVELAGDVDSSRIDIDWDDTLERILASNPMVAAAMADVETARWVAAREVAQVKPDIDVRAVVHYDDLEQDTVAGIEFGVRLPIFNRNQGAIQRAQYDIAAAQRAVDWLSLSLQNRLTIVFRSYANARQQVERYSREGGILETASKTLELLRTGYQAGEFGLLDLLAAQRTYFQSNLAYLESLQSLATTVAEIQGLLLKGSTGISGPSALATAP